MNVRYAALLSSAGFFSSALSSGRSISAIDAIARYDDARTTCRTEPGHETHDDVRRKHWELIGKMQDEQAQMNEQCYSEQRDDAALSASYRKKSDLRHQMFDLSLSAQKQIDSVLTQEQRQKQKRG